jgi:hypothetical protein
VLLQDLGHDAGTLLLGRTSLLLHEFTSFNALVYRGKHRLDKRFHVCLQHQVSARLGYIHHRNMKDEADLGLVGVRIRIRGRE